MALDLPFARLAPVLPTPMRRGIPSADDGELLNTPVKRPPRMPMPGVSVRFPVTPAGKGQASSPASVSLPASACAAGSPQHHRTMLLDFVRASSLGNATESPLRCSSRIGSPSRPFHTTTSLVAKSSAGSCSPEVTAKYSPAVSRSLGDAADVSYDVDGSSAVSRLRLGTVRYSTPLLRRVSSPCPDMWRVSSSSSSPHVWFNNQRNSRHDITPYSEIYGVHPRFFNFDSEGDMVPPSPKPVASLRLSESCPEPCDSCSPGNVSSQLPGVSEASAPQPEILNWKPVPALPGSVKVPMGSALALGSDPIPLALVQK